MYPYNISAYMYFFKFAIINTVAPITNTETNTVIKFIINVSVNFYDDLCSEIKSLEQVGYFYVLPKENIGDEESDFCSLKTGFNYKPTILKLY